MNSCPGKENHDRQNTAFGVLLIAITLGGGPAACLSDVVVPECVAQHTPCGGASGAAGVPESSNAGEAGNQEDADRGVAGAHDTTAGGLGGVAGKVAGGGAGAGHNVAGHNVADSAGAGNGGAGNGDATAGSGGADNGGAAARSRGQGGALPCVSCELAPRALPEPCQSSPYSTTLTVSGGVPPYAWRVVPASSQWSIAADPANSAQGLLTGQVTSPTSLSVEVTDALGLAVSRSFDLHPRTGCWFAYTALEATGPHLNLLDPILRALPPTPLAHNDGVYDFQFSPNGQYLAYRYGADSNYPKGKHLSIVSLSAWIETPLSLNEDAVTAYSWSSDSSVLAVAFQTGSVTSLGGVRLIPGFAPGLSPVIQTLASTPVLVDSALYWVDGSYLAFDATILIAPDGSTLPNPAQRRTPYYTAIGSLGFAAPVPFPNVSYAPTVFVQPAQGGFFMTAASPSTNFYSLPSGLVARHQFVDLVAPSGRFTAQLDDGQLLVFGAKEGNLTDAEYTSADTGDCPKLLAWAKGTESIACVANVESDPPGTTHGEVRFFDLQPPSTLTMRPLGGFCEKGASAAPCGTSQYDYTEENSELEARAFSPSGRWFAFTTAAPAEGGSYVYWADVNAQPLIVKRKLNVTSTLSTSTSPSALSYSPDERFLLVQLGNVLTAYDLMAPSPFDFGSGAAFLSFDLITGTAQATSPCSEDYSSAPARWCGGADRALSFAWAPDSRRTAHRVAGHLVVSDLTQFSVTVPYTLDAADCNAQCASQFAFQPQP